MLLHTHRYNDTTQTWEFASAPAGTNEAANLLTLDKPTVLILPGGECSDSSAEKNVAISKVLTAVHPFAEKLLVNPKEPNHKTLNCTLFSWKGISHEDVKIGIRESTSNIFSPSEEATQLAKSIWNAVCNHANSTNPSKEKIIAALSNLSIFCHSYGTIFGEKLSLALSEELAHQIDPEKENGRHFSEEDIKTILHSVIQINIASLSNLAQSDKKTFSQYSFCAINDDVSLGYIEDAYADSAVTVAEEIGYPPVDEEQRMIAVENGMLSTQDHLAARQMPCGVAISDFVQENGYPHTARTQTTRGPHQRGYANMFERLMHNAIARKEPFGDLMQPFLTSPKFLFPSVQVTETPLRDHQDRLLTERVVTAIRRGSPTTSLAAE